jgi:hypothetical protein
MARRRKVRGAFARRKGKIGSIVTETGEAAHNARYVVVPSTRNEIVRMVKKSRAKGVIETPEQTALVIKGLITFGAHEAGTTGRKKIRVQDVKRGYERQARLVFGGIGNHPPHLCFRRVILHREPEIRAMKAFRELEESSKKK